MKTEVIKSQGSEIRIVPPDNIHFVFPQMQISTDDGCGFEESAYVDLSRDAVQALINVLEEYNADEYD